VITSAENERLKLVRKLQRRRWRDKLGLFVAEGEDLVAAARAAGIEPVELLVAGETVEPRLLAEASMLGHAARVVAVFRRDDLRRGAVEGFGVALWRVADPGNLGTLVRASDGFSPGYVALSAGCADPLSPKALRASAGAVFRVPLVRFDEAPRPWLALVPRGAPVLWEVEVGDGATFVLGAERAGLPRELLARCDGAATIPLAVEADSLNVAVAGAVALYEARRRRR
jgi:RNA methyltransferase, TrmH family